MEQDRRANMRKAFGKEVVINHEKGLRFCKLKDISEGGALLDIGWGALTRNVPLELSVSLPLAPNGNQSLRIPAHVARVSTNGTAVAFNDLDRQARQLISSFVDA